jgi:hypothetical protein
MNPLAMRLDHGLAGRLLIPPNFKYRIAAIGRYERGGVIAHRFSDDEMSSMVKEWPAYMDLCSRMPVEQDDLKPDHIMKRATFFWKVARVQVPNLAKLARYAFLLAPSSAAAERVFSVLKRFFSLLQMFTSLTDLTEASIMLQYNKKAFTSCCNNYEI